MRLGALALAIVLAACAEEDRDCDARAEDGRCCRVTCVGEVCETTCDPPLPAVGLRCAEAMAAHEACCAKLTGERFDECEAALRAAEYERSDDQTCLERSDAFECPVS